MVAIVANMMNTSMPPTKTKLPCGAAFPEYTAMPEMLLETLESAVIVPIVDIVAQSMSITFWAFLLIILSPPMLNIARFFK